MKLLFFLFTLAFLPPSTDQPYELKGEAPGMTLKAFKSNHKHAECSRQSATLTRCHVYDGVSFAGVAANTFIGCTTPECAFQGMFTDFVDDRMVRLRYAVSMGSANTVIAALKNKYGEPTKSTENPNMPGTLSSATWKNAVGHLSVSDTWAPSGRPLESYTDITSAFNDAGEGKDI